MVVPETTRRNIEFHDLIDVLSEQKLFGEVTLYFQGGNIETGRITERKTKAEVREMMQARGLKNDEEKRKAKVVVRRPAGSA